MGFFRNGDPLDDFDRLDLLQARREAALPVCDKCGKPITEEKFFNIGGEILHEECMRDMYECNTEDYLEDI